MLSRARSQILSSSPSKPQATEKSLSIPQYGVTTYESHMGSKHIATDSSKKGLSLRTLFLLIVVIFGSVLYIILAFSGPEMWEPTKLNKIRGLEVIHI